MAIAIAEVAATGADLRDESAQDAIVQRWYEWSRDAKDVGIQTRSVLSGAARGGVITAASARAESAKLHERSGRTGGQWRADAHGAGRTRVSRRRGRDGRGGAGDQRAHALRAGCRRRVRAVVQRNPACGPHRRAGCASRLAPSQVWPTRHVGQASRRRGIGSPGIVSEQRMGGHSAAGGVVSDRHNAGASGRFADAGVFRADHLRSALDAAVRAGYDTDTVAAIAGGLLGAAYGASAVPGAWRMLLHGWPGTTAHDLVALATAIERKGKPDGFDFSYASSAVDTYARHPYDDGVLLGGIGVLRQLPAEVDAVVSLCRLADEDMRDDMPHVEVRLIDRPEYDENPHLDFVLLDTVSVIEQFRREGRTVLVHCVGAYSRTPTIGALYGARLRNINGEEALRDVIAALPGANPNHVFRDALRRIQFAKEMR